MEKLLSILLFTSCVLSFKPVANSCEHCNEPSGSIKGVEFFD